MSADPARCVVLVPVGGHVEPECEAGLRRLEAAGYPVRRVQGYAAIDQARSQIASDALADGFDELLWIDSDVVFDVDDVRRLREHDVPIVCGIYPKKNSRALSCHLLPDTRTVRFGTHGGLLEIRYAATGFLLTRREVYDGIARHEQLPVCNQRFSTPVVPYFLPLLIPDGDGTWYLGEDFAFCERARRSGFTILADTRIKLGHVGSYRYSWEDAGASRERYADYEFTVWTASPEGPTISG
ncbi:hypothetical protein GCM10023200_37330 [Actinomycetospora chlora]|uniref:Glycosyltransferase n=1 Tax=Actinomycetospora chlora TaxID=663608 RepID=A0ABP9BM45_9PSEU